MGHGAQGAGHRAQGKKIKDKSTPADSPFEGG